MFTPRTNDSMPLRETCDRCRELKVRCRKNESATATTGPCIRCARARSNCSFSPKQPSGRPLTGQGARKDVGVNRASHGLAPATSDAQWPTADFFNDELLSDMIEMEPANCGGPMFDTIRSLEYENDSPESLRTQGFMDPTERVIRQISDLNLRIYHAMQAASACRPVSVSSETIAGGSLPSSDELIELTSGVMEIGAQVIKPQGQSRRSSAGPGALIPYPFSGTSCHDERSLPTLPPAQPIVDTSAILMVLSCHDRLLGLFCFVCASLQSQEAQRLKVPPGGEEGGPLASAQVVMTVELINHLLERLDRSRRQAMGALNANPEDQQQLPTPSAIQGEGPHGAAGLDDMAGWKADETMVGVLQVKQAWLHTSIRTIKAIVSEQGTI